MTAPIGRDGIPAGPLRDLLDYWARLRRDGGPPPVSALELAEIPAALLRHIAVSTGRLPDGRMRLVFTGSVPIMFGGRDPTGLYMDEVYPPEHYALGLIFFNAIIDGRCPVYVEDAVGADGEVKVKVERLGLPFVGPDGTVERIATGMVFHPLETARGGRFHTIRPDSPVELVSRETRPVRLGPD